MNRAAIATLLGKELRQTGRNRSAMLTATLLPLLIMLVAPLGALVQLRLAGGARGLEQLQAVPLTGLSSLADPEQLLVQFMYPLFFTLGGLMLPSLTTTYAIVAERERRSLELLIALPVTVGEILLAKLLAVLVVSLIVVLPLFAIVVSALLVLGVADATAIPYLLLPLVAALACSTCVALLITLLARDFRTANNLNGALFVPLLLLSMATLAAVGGPGRTAVLSALLLAAGLVALAVAIRWVTFERYLE